MACITESRAKELPHQDIMSEEMHLAVKWQSFALILSLFQCKWDLSFTSLLEESFSPFLSGIMRGGRGHQYTIRAVWTQDVNQCRGTEESLCVW